MNGTAGVQEVRSLPPDYRRIGSCTSNGLYSETVPDTIPTFKLLRHTYLLRSLARLLIALSLSSPISITLIPSPSSAQESIKAFKNLSMDAAAKTALDNTARAQLSDELRRGRALRFRHVQIDTSRFKKDALLVFNLFPNLSLNIQNKLLEETRPGITNWAGQVVGRHRTMGRAFFTLKDGKIYGTIHSGSRIFEVRSISQDIYRITEFDITKFPDEGGGPPPTTPRPHPAIIPSETLMVSDDGSTGSCQIDIMVLYTARVLTEAGGEAALLLKIDNAVDSTNNAFLGSGVVHRLNLIHTQQVSYSEQGQSSHQVILDTLLNPSGTALASVPALRTDKNADIVSLWIDYNSNQYCGWANDMPPPSISPDLDHSNAYNIVETRCALTKYSFAHEVGHNMGAYHDRSSDGLKSSEDIDHDNRGDCNENLWHGTIMAKKSGCGGDNFARQPFWSTPSSTYNDGSPMGHLMNTNDAANNSRYINQDTGHLVAKFRGKVCGSSSDTTPPMPPTGLKIH
jgi:hypothetical protein